MKCSSPEGAANASKALHGRWFAGRFTTRSVPLAEFVMCVIVTTVLIWIFSP